MAAGSIHPGSLWDCEDGVGASLEKLWRQHALVTRKLKGLRLDVPFEVLKKTDLSEGLLTLASGLCGAMTFQELRKVIGREVHTLEEYVLMAEELAAGTSSEEAA